MGRLTGWFPVVLLAVLAALTFWLDRQVQSGDRARDGKLRHDPDYIAQNIAGTNIGPDGVALYTLTAKSMVHYPDDDTTYVEAPKLVQFRPAGMTITATSKNATLSSNGDHVYLTGDVRLVRSAYENKSALTVETTYLHVVAKDNFAETDRPVRIFDASTLTTAVGLEFNTETHILKLHSNVRGQYAKPKRAQ